MIKNIDWVIATENGIYNFYATEDLAAAALPNARASYERSLKFWQEHYDETLPDGRAEEEKRHLDRSKSDLASIAVMKYEDFAILEAEKFDKMPLEEITEELFDYYLECLPPLKWDRRRFFCAEAFSGLYHSEYLMSKGKFYTKIVNITKPTTWIENRHKEQI